MTSEQLHRALRVALETPPPLPGHGQTPQRHSRLMQIGRENVSLARLAEAHWDAVAILAEANAYPKQGAIYGVWASEKPGEPLHLQREGRSFSIHGTKRFCSGAGLVDRALLTVRDPEERLLDIDLRAHADAITFDESDWKTDAFRETRTATATFLAVPISEDDIIREPGWYLNRPGFWQGACGPAACWAGGAAGLVAYAAQQSRDDPHTLAHLGAMHTSVWAMQSFLETAGHEIDANPGNASKARTLALVLRHLVEQACTDVLRRLARAYGPHPLALDEEVSLRCRELDLYLRQSHAERDLEALGRECRRGRQQLCATAQ